MLREVIKRWLLAGGDLDAGTPGAHRTSSHHETHPWYLVIWLTGVDYFSTLGYQPGIALLAAGAISPLATTVLVAVTLACALPIYAQVAGRSYVGQGSIAMLENLLPGWKGRVFVLVLLGFAATDFVITMTLSAADAAEHAVQNPYLHPFLHHANMKVTLLLLVLLALVFLKGFKEAIEFATVVCIPYLLLNVVVLVRGLYEVISHPALFSHWRNALSIHGDSRALLIAALIAFPRLALGLSGFETGVSVMPLIRGDDSDETAERPAGRIRNTRKLLATAAVIMSVMLIVSSFVTTLLISPQAYREGGPASGRAIAYLAHQLLGNAFGSLYDFSTILILWFAGASAMAGLLHLIPRYLPRVGLAPQWVAYARPLVLVLFGFDVIVTLVFRANVEAQGGAYATGVLVLMLSAATAATVTTWKESRAGQGSYGVCLFYALVTLVFLYTTLANIAERPDGIIIASFFIVFTLSLSGISRYVRAKELRVTKIDFADEESEGLWKQISGKKVNFVPVHSFSKKEVGVKCEKIRKNYKAEGPLAFVHVGLLDNRSEFLGPIAVRIRQQGNDYRIDVSHAVAIANTIAYLTVKLEPISIILGLSRLNLMEQSLRYFLFGEGETGLMVYTILVHYWASVEDEVRPKIFLMSD